MGYYDQLGEYSSTAFASDTEFATLAPDESSLFEDAGNVLTKGIPLTGLAIVNSFANTGIDIANFFGGDYESWKVTEQIDDIEWQKYYSQHEFGIEAAGLVAGSLIPGLGAVKGVNVATRLAIEANKAGRITGIMSRATGLLPAAIKDSTIASVQAEVQGGKTLFNLFNAEKMKAVAAGFGDQAIQAFAYEVATAATMKGSPLLDDLSLKEVADTVMWGTITGGAIGGVIDGIGTLAILRKAKNGADSATKQFERYGLTGIGAYTPGDELVEVGSFLAKADPAEEGLSFLAKSKLSRSVKDAELKMRNLFSTAASGDKDVGNSVAEFVFGSVKTGSWNEEAAFQLSRLSKVSRVTDPLPASDPSVFFINKAIAPGKSLTLDNLLSSSPGIETPVGYRLADTALEVRVASAMDKVEVTPALSIAKYPSVKSAYDDGVDIFIDSKQRVHVNPGSSNIVKQENPMYNRQLSAKEARVYAETGKLPEGSTQLLGGTEHPVWPARVLDVRRAVTMEGSGVTPYVGDFGKVKLLDNGLQYGSKFSAQSRDSLITAASGTEDASARYVWAAMKEYKKGETILSGDIAELDALLYKSQSAKTWDSFVEELTKKNVTIADDVLPASRDELLARIKSEKDRLLSEYLVAPDASISKAARLANIEEDYIANGLSGAEELYAPSPTNHAKINHVRLEYDVGNVRFQDGNFVKGALDHQYRVELVKSANLTQAAAMFGEDVEKFIINGSSLDAELSGAGHKWWSFASGDYNSLAQKTERVGRHVSDKIKQAMQANSEYLAPAFNELRKDSAAAAEASAFINVRRRTSESFIFLDAEVAAKEGIVFDAAAGERVAVLKKAVSSDKAGITWDKSHLPEGFIQGGAHTKQGLRNYYVLSKKVADFEEANQIVNARRVNSINGFYAATGLARSLDPNVLHAPAINVGKYKHFALVRAKEGTAMADDGVAVIVAQNAEALEQKMASISDSFDVFTKSHIKKYHEALGDYDYNRNFAQSNVDNFLARKGILSDIYPETNIDNIIEDYVGWHTRSESRVIRDHVELANAQLFAELRAMGARFTDAELSVRGFTAPDAARKISNPMDSYIRTSLNLSQKDNYKLWVDATEKVEAFADTAFNAAAKAFHNAKAGHISYEEAAATMERFGLGNPYARATSTLEEAARVYSDVANRLPDKKYLQAFVNKATAILGATVIRWDHFQHLVDILSMPILTAMEASSVKTAAGRGAFMTALPDGSGRMVPATSKLFFNTLTDYFDKPTKQAALKYFDDIKVLRLTDSELDRVMDTLQLPLSKDAGFLEAKAKKLGELADTVSGYRISEEFTSFMTAGVAKRLFESLGYSGQDLADHILTFVNRAKVNNLASQRPIAFQGPVGQSIGLFQSYYFNLLQNLFRHVENKDLKTMAVFAGLQSTIFGMQSMPGFHIINNHIIGTAAGNVGHNDAYSATKSFAGADLGNYLLYGVASNVFNAGIYTRADINPRNLTILPTNPLDYPAISGGIKFIGNLLDTAQKISNGADVGDALLLGLEHNGLSRPLQGLAQIVQGYSTTTKGNLVSARPLDADRDGVGWNDIFNAAIFSRLGGSRPLDEAIALEMNYRHTMYKAKTTANITALGEAVKTKLYGNEQPEPEETAEFIRKYAAAGGNVKNFNRQLLTWSHAANASLANEFYKKLGDPVNQSKYVIMGGKRLPDFYSNPTTSGAEEKVQ